MPSLAKASHQKYIAILCDVEGGGEVEAYIHVYLYLLTEIMGTLPRHCQVPGWRSEKHGAEGAGGTNWISFDPFAMTALKQ